MLRSIHVLACCLSLAFFPCTCSTVLAQAKTGGKKAEPISGSVVSIEKEKTGKNYRMKIKNEDDEEIDVPLLPRTQLAVVAKGDEGFLKQTVYLQTKAAQAGTGTDLFAKDFTVYLGGVTPSPFFKPDPMAQSVFEVGGKIIDMNDKGMMVQCGPQPRMISFEEEKNVTVRIADASYIKEGDEVEIEGTMIKSKKQFNARTVTVKSATDISSAEYFAALEESRKPKSKSKTAKSKTDGDTPAGDVEDPFGLSKNKGKGKDDKKEKKEDKSDATDAKKDDVKKDDSKQEESADKKPEAGKSEG